LFDPEIGNGHLMDPLVPIDSTTPYVRIIGEGNDTADVYSFDIRLVPTVIMVENSTLADTFDRTGNDSSNTTGSLKDDASYYTSVTIALTGKVKEGDVWRLGIGYRDFVTPAASSTDSLISIANVLKNLIDGAQTAGYIYGYEPVVVDSTDLLAPTITIINNNGFTLKGRTETSEDLNGNGVLDVGEDTNGNGRLDPGPDELQHTVADAGSVKRTTTAENNTGTPIQFNGLVDPVLVILSATGVFNSDDVWTLKLNNTSISVDGTSASDVVQKLAAA
jgi:hypothetical protein